MIDWFALRAEAARTAMTRVVAPRSHYSAERELAVAVILDLESRGLAGLGITVTVRSGVVTLTGLCPSAEACEAVVSAVLQVHGVSSVYDLLNCTTA